MPLAAGARFGPYQIVAPIGAGGMGEVYRARDERLGREVALKVLTQTFQGDPDRLRRFTDEAKAAGALSHPGILAVHDVGSENGAPYMVSELLEGETLRERMLAGKLPVRKAIDIAVQVAQALAAAHDKNIVHRDLKPENLFLCEDGRVKILDFGLAKALTIEGTDAAMASTMAQANVTGSGAVLGTSGYMAPEQVRGEAVDRRTDLFAFGSVLYEMLAGRPAFPGATHVERGYAVLKDEPPPLPAAEGMSPTIEAIVRRCLEKRPGDRFQSARDLAFSLQALTSMGTASGPTLPLSASSVIAPLPSRRLPLVVGAALAAVAAAAIGFFVGRGHGSPPPRPPAAVANASGAPPTIQRLIYRRGTVSNARFAPDGKRVIASAIFDGEKEAGYEILPGRTDLRTLTGPNARVFDVSRDGQLALAVRSSDGRSQSFATAEPGSAPRSLVDGVLMASYGPDGQTIALARNGGQGSVIEWPMGHTVYETAHNINFLRVSPKGDRIAFVECPVRNDDRGYVMVVDASGKSKQVGKEWYSLEGVAFSPDGSEAWIAASVGVEQKKIYGLGIDDAHERVVATAPGDLVLFDVDANGRALVAIQSAYNRILGLQPGAEKPRDLAWFDRDQISDMTPDGKLILFYDGGVAGGTNYSVFVRPTNGDPATRIGTGRAYALSPDGKWAIVAPEPPWNHITVIPTGAGAPKQQPPGDVVDFGFARFAGRSDRWVVLGRAAKGTKFRLWVEDDGKPPVPIGPDSVFNVSKVSSDGKLIAVMTPDGPFLAPLDGGQAKPIEGLPADSFPLNFSVDSKSLIVAVRDKGVFGFDLATKKLTPIMTSTNAAVVAGNINNPQFTPDMKGWAYEMQLLSSELYLIDALR